MDMTTDMTHAIQISFGDCDPAGIVFYPNNFRWMDATFHAFLNGFGGHEAMCRQLGALGFGLVDASAKFRHPMRNGDLLDLRLTALDWSSRTLSVSYAGQVGGKTTFEGREVRCLFMRAETGIVAADIAPLRALLEARDVR